MLAGAGTGKTRAITHRIAYAVATGVVNPAQVLALTFTVRAAGELRGRLRALGGGAEAVRATTFHAAALRQLTLLLAAGDRRPGAAARGVEAAAAAGGGARPGLRLDGAALAEAVTEIEWAKVCQIHPDSYVFAGATAGRAPVGRRRGDRAAVRGLRGAAPGPAADRLRVGARADGGDPAHRARAAREVHAAFRYFTVDEFQDVNPLQKLLLDAWLGGREELCVVGDPQQTIYSFTGATS